AVRWIAEVLSESPMCLNFRPTRSCEDGVLLSSTPARTALDSSASSRNRVLVRSLGHFFFLLYKSNGRRRLGWRSKPRIALLPARNNPAFQRPSESGPAALCPELRPETEFIAPASGHRLPSSNDCHAHFHAPKVKWATVLHSWHF